MDESEAGGATYDPEGLHAVLVPDGNLIDVVDAGEASLL